MPNAWFSAYIAVVLVHTRLSIIDLSSTGAQPMTNENRTVRTVCNGEIYNDRELRRDIEACGHVFHEHSDTEVLPHPTRKQTSKSVSVNDRWQKG